MLNYIQYHEHDTSHQSLSMITANVSGDLVQLPAGPMDFAAGYEYRDLSGNYQPDAVVVAGDSNGVPSKPTSGSYNVDEFYVELNIPILADMAIAKHLDFNVATRYSDYSTFGSTTNSKFGFRWQVVDDLTFRGTYAQGFRAPSIGELFGTFSRFDATLTDPCNNATGQRATNCVDARRAESGDVSSSRIRRSPSSPAATATCSRKNRATPRSARCTARPGRRTRRGRRRWTSR